MCLVYLGCWTGIFCTNRRSINSCSLRPFELPPPLVYPQVTWIESFQAQVKMVCLFVSVPLLMVISTNEWFDYQYFPLGLATFLNWWKSWMASLGRFLVSGFWASAPRRERKATWQWTNYSVGTSPEINCSGQFHQHWLSNMYRQPRKGMLKGIWNLNIFAIFFYNIWKGFLKISVKVVQPPGPPTTTTISTRGWAKRFSGTVHKFHLKL